MSREYLLMASGLKRPFFPPNLLLKHEFGKMKQLARVWQSMVGRQCKAPCITDAGPLKGSLASVSVEVPLHVPDLWSRPF